MNLNYLKLFENFDDNEEEWHGYDTARDNMDQLGLPDESVEAIVQIVKDVLEEKGDSGSVVIGQKIFGKKGSIEVELVPQVAQGSLTNDEVHEKIKAYMKTNHPEIQVRTTPGNMD